MGEGDLGRPERVVVIRSPLRAWLVAVLGIPFLVLGVQLIGEGELIRAIGELVYGREDAVPAPGWRDVVWGWALALGGGAAMLWGLFRLVRPARVVTADREGVRLAVSGPLRPPLRLGWDQVVELRPSRVGDAGRELPALALVVKDPSVLPERAWGARRADGWTLLVMAEDWNVSPAVAVERLEAVRPGS